MGLFGKSKKEKELELQNKLLKEMLAEKAKKAVSAPKKKQVLYQCRYCGYKSIRNATDGSPIPQSNCPKHPKGWCKGPHSFQRTYL